MPMLPGGVDCVWRLRAVVVGLGVAVVAPGVVPSSVKGVKSDCSDVAVR